MSGEATKKPADIPPLPLSSLLHDLAVIRANDVDLNAILQETGVNSFTPKSTDPDTIKHSLDNSLEFIRHARSALKSHSSGELEKLGLKIERIRGVMEDVLDSLSSGTLKDS